MKHRIGYNRLSRTTSHRKAMLRNMVMSLFKYGRIKTTKAKAAEVKRLAEKMITRARVDSVHNRRIIAKKVTEKALLAKLFTDIAPRYLNRGGGYTRCLKLGFRQGDAAEIVLLELIVDDTPGDESKKKKPAKKTKKAKAETSTGTKVIEDKTTPSGESETTKDEPQSSAKPEVQEEEAKAKEEDAGTQAVEAESQEQKSVPEQTGEDSDSSEPADNKNNKTEDPDPEQQNK